MHVLMSRRPALSLLLLVGTLGWLSSGILAFPALATVGLPTVGRILEGHRPSQGARVRYQARPGAALSDPAGRFILPGDPSARRITASKNGFLIAGAHTSSSPLTLRLEPLPAEDCERYTWVDPTPDAARSGNCGNCHAGIYREWRASGHSRSLTGRHFRNLYEGSDWQGRPNKGWSLLAEHPLGAGVCASCHAPGLEPRGDVLDDLRKVDGVAALGVHCDYCHKIQDVAGGDLGLTHGRYDLKLLRPAQGQLFFGPLDDVDRREDAYSPLYQESRYCASCHEGVVFGVPVYTTYSEWRNSPAAREGKQCQTCHMKPTGTLTNIAPGHGGVERDAKTLANHRFFAGDKADMLRNCLHLDVRLEPSRESVRTHVTVTAEEVGHRVPTGFIDRNLVLVVEAFDASGRTRAARDGPVLPPMAGKDTAGRSGRLYAKLLTGFDGSRPAPFWRSDPEPEDTRLTPGQPDRSTYAFPPQTRRVRVRLLYRRFWPDVAAVKAWPDNEIQLAEKVIDLDP
jgi:hypothetical protein